MDYNLSLLDIFARYALILVLGILFGITQYYILVVLAIAVFISAVSGWCPIYHVFGISTKTKEEE